ncbi:MAG: hypothetical protein IKA61_03195 [Clostridia bacterium]|nr:hypothetical protein [Clostridia bacterium]
MRKETKLKIQKIIIEIAGVCALLGLIWSPGRLIFHDIPAIIRGYENVAVEWGEEDDYMGINKTVVTKTVKKKITFGEAMSEIVGNLIVTFVSVGFFLSTPSYKIEDDIED